MHIPSNKWCEGSGRAAKEHLTKARFAQCPVCGYGFRFFHGVVPKHRPLFSAKAKGAKA